MNDIALIESNETSHSSENVGRHSLLKVVVFYLILLLLVFSHCLSYPLLDWDDEKHLTQNPYLNPDSPGNLGTTLQIQGQHIQATPCFKTAIKYADDFAPAYYNLAESLQQLQQSTAALSALNTKRNWSPQDRSRHKISKIELICIKNNRILMMTKDIIKGSPF